MEGIDQRVLQTHFGAFLKMQRVQWGVRQRDVLLYFPGWTQANYSRLESGAIAPAFDQLLPLYSALLRAGVHWNATDRQRFLTLARARMRGKKSHADQHTDSEWAELRYQMAEVDFFPDEPTTPATPWAPPQPLLAETRHLLGREAWYGELIGAVQTRAPKKLMVVQGPVGIGKSSALHRLIQHFISVTDPAYHVMWIPFLPAERGVSSESSLELVLGNILAESGSPALEPDMASWQQRQRLALALLEQSGRPVVILVDNAESVLTEEGMLAACWEEFLDHFLRHQHKATLIMATKEWPGWSGRNRALVSEYVVPPLDMATSILLLQQQGLEAVPVEQLQEVWRRVGGIPLCLEWVASLAQNPHQLNQWQSFDIVEEEYGQVKMGEKAELEVRRRLTRLLAEPMLLRGHLANKLRPLLERLIEKRLSAEARVLLNALAVCNVPLGKTALQALCEHPGLINELRNASLLVSYAHRVQVLPIVAAVVTQGLTAEQVRELEAQAIDGLRRWVDEGTIAMQEAGAVITELAMLLLKHYRLLEAAELLIRYGWLGFNQGHAPEIAHLAEKVMNEFDWHKSVDDECGGWMLHYFLSPFIGRLIDIQQRRADYTLIREALLARKIMLQPPIEVAITYNLMIFAMNDQRFEDARALLELCDKRLATYLPSSVDLQASLLEKRAWLYVRWNEYAEEQGETSFAEEYKKQAIILYKQIVALVTANGEDSSHLKSIFLKKRLARAYNNLGYELSRICQYEEALQPIDNSIMLKEQGYAEVDTLADAYGEKSQILASLGRFREALLFDDRAYSEVQRLVDAGYTFSKEEIWIYRVNRGRLFLLLGRIGEAEDLLHGAIHHINPQRRIYQLFAKKGLEEIEHWRKTKSSHYQLDWRWVERYRELASFDSYWWLAPAGPFSEEEQRQWNQMFTSNPDEKTKELLGKITAESCQHELDAAIEERREPELRYPALVIEEVRNHITGLLELDTEICQEEPNAIVRRLYYDVIEEELSFLRMIEATYEGDNERFWECNLVLNPPPTHEEMSYALSRVRHIVLQGLLHPETVEASQTVNQFLQEHLKISLDLSYSEQEAQELQKNIPLASPYPRKMVSVSAARRFFEAVLYENGYKEWQVTIDANASVPRVEQGLRHLYLPDSSMSLQEIKDYVTHELGGHVARCIAGEQSSFGLLGIHTKGSLEIEEGLATYYDIEAAKHQGQEHDETAIWFGTLATGFASGVDVPPQTFMQLFTFFELFIYLYRLLKRPDQKVQTAAKWARKLAFARCLRTYRGVPDLNKAGICYTKDVLYLRGLWKVEQAIAQDPTFLDRLAVGVIALDQLPDLQELDIVASSQPLRKLVQDPNLETYILSFEELDERTSSQIGDKK